MWIVDADEIIILFKINLSFLESGFVGFRYNNLKACLPVAWVEKRN